jgi:hypothetical protein
VRTLFSNTTGTSNTASGARAVTVGGVATLYYRRAGWLSWTCPDLGGPGEGNFPRLLDDSGNPSLFWRDNSLLPHDYRKISIILAELSQTAQDPYVRDTRIVRSEKEGLAATPAFRSVATQTP